MTVHMNIVSAKFWRLITGLLVGALLDVVALWILGESKTFSGIPSSLQWAESLLMPPLAIAALFDTFPNPPGLLADLINSVALFLVFGLYPIALAIMFALPWEEKRNKSIIITLGILFVIASLGYVSVATRP